MIRKLKLDMIRNSLIGRRLKKYHSDGTDINNRLIIDIRRDYYGNAVFYFSKVYSNGAVLVEKETFFEEKTIMELIKNNSAHDDCYIYELISPSFEQTIEKWREAAEKKGLKLIIENEKNNFFFNVGINSKIIDNVPQDSVLYAARMALAMKDIKVDYMTKEEIPEILDFDKIKIPDEAIIEEREYENRRGNCFPVFVVRIENLTNFKENTDYWREVRDKILFGYKGWENSRINWGKGWVLRSLTDAQEVVRLIIQYGGKFIKQEKSIIDGDWKNAQIPAEVIIEKREYTNQNGTTIPVWQIRTENLKGIKKRSTEWRTILSLLRRQLDGWINKNKDWGEGLILRSLADAQFVARAILKNGGVFATVGV